MNKIVTVIGARPQFVKMALVSKALKSVRVKEVVVHTGQHYDRNMSSIFFRELGIGRPKYNLGIGSLGRREQIDRMRAGVEKVLELERPGAVLVYGDTNSTLAGAGAASKVGIPVAHVEAGLRSFDPRMDEEKNRVAVDRVSDLLFCPTKAAVRNLRAEGIRKNVFLVGDVMYDSIARMGRCARDPAKERYVLCTIHRAENTDSRKNMRAIFKGLEAAGDRVIMPLHPRTARAIAGFGIRIPRNVAVTKPVGYHAMLDLERGADAVITDSGGVQKEAFIFGLGCVTVRDSTEWVETVRCGMNVLAGADAGRISRGLARMKRLNRKADPREHYGDGYANRKIAGILDKYLRGLR